MFLIVDQQSNGYITGKNKTVSQGYGVTEMKKYRSGRNEVLRSFDGYDARFDY
jgi:hypothetical protein